MINMLSFQHSKLMATLHWLCAKWAGGGGGELHKQDLTLGELAADGADDFTCCFCFGEFVFVDVSRVTMTGSCASGFDALRYMWT